MVNDYCVLCTDKAKLVTNTYNKELCRVSSQLIEGNDYENRQSSFLFSLLALTADKTQSGVLASQNGDGNEIITLQSV